MFRIFYILIYFASCQAPEKAWDYHTIDNSGSGADGVKFADYNNDGLTDIVTGWEESGFTKLYLHPGVKQVRNKWPSQFIGTTPSVEDAVFADMNNDGFLDIVSCTEGKSKKILVHFSQNNKTGESNWKQEILPASDQLMQWMYAEPIQLDGLHGIDLIAAGKNHGGKIGWFQAPEDSDNFDAWKWHSISPMGWVMSILLKDMDNDGDIDIIVTDRIGEMQACRWLENPGIGEQQKEEWNSHVIGGVGLELMFMCVKDLNADGIEEIILTERTNQTIRIYKRQNKSGLNWEEHIIPVPATTGNCKSVEAGDINGDGVIDLVLSTNTDKAEKVGLTWIDGSKIDNIRPSDFQAISGIHVAKYDKVELIDMDLDGDLDILICEENYGDRSEGLGVIWYENTINKN